MGCQHMKPNLHNLKIALIWPLHVDIEHISLGSIINGVKLMALQSFILAESSVIFFFILFHFTSWCVISLFYHESVISEIKCRCIFDLAKNPNFSIFNFAKKKADELPTLSRFHGLILIEKLNVDPLVLINSGSVPTKKKSKQTKKKKRNNHKMI